MVQQPPIRGASSAPGHQFKKKWIRVRFGAVSFSSGSLEGELSYIFKNMHPKKWSF